MRFGSCTGALGGAPVLPEGRVIILDQKAIPCMQGHPGGMVVSQANDQYSGKS